MFEKIIGQTHAMEVLKRCIERNAFPGAFLFLGPNGVGRKLAAIELAKYVNCSGTDAPCNECPSCVSVETGSHPYVNVIDFDWQENFLKKSLKEISIDTVREIQRILSLKMVQVFGGKDSPARPRRFVIMDDVRKLSYHASNCFLKTLEEPPLDTTIILIANSTRQLLATIVSRCQVVKFYPIGETEISGLLKRMDAGLSEEKQALLARLSEGSVSKAIKYLNRWDEYVMLKDEFLNLSFDKDKFKDVDMNEFVEFLLDFYKTRKHKYPGVHFYEALFEAEIQSRFYLNKHLILTQLHSRIATAMYDT